MKKILFTLMALVCSMSMNAQVMKIMKNGEEVATYKGSDYTVVFGEETEADPWQSIGMCKYTEDVIGPVFGFDPVTYEVEVRVNPDKPGIYRMVNPYGKAFPYNEEGDWDASRDYFIDINAEDPKGVYIEEQQTGLDWGYGMMSISIMSIGYYYMAAGNSFETVKNVGYMGTLENNVITFPVNGMVVAIKDGMYYANKHGAFLLDLTPVNDKAKKATARKSIDKKIKAEKSDLTK